MPSLSHEGSDIASWLGDLAPDPCRHGGSSADYLLHSSKLRPMQQKLVRSRQQQRPCGDFITGRIGSCRVRPVDDGAVEMIASLGEFPSAVPRSIARSEENRLNRERKFIEIEV